MKFDPEAVQVMLYMIREYGFAPVTITKQGIELLTIPQAIAIAKKIEPEVKEDLRKFRQRERWKVYT